MAVADKKKSEDAAAAGAEEQALEIRDDFDDDAGALAAFMRRNRKPLVAACIGLAGAAVAAAIVLAVLDRVKAGQLAELERCISRYESLAAEAGDGAIPASADADSLLDDLLALGGRASGYAGAKALSLAGDLDMGREAWADAEAAYLRAVEKGKKLYIAPVALYNAGVAAERQDNADLAIAHYEASLAYDGFPGGARAQFAIGRLNEKKADTEGALAAYRNVADKWPDTEWEGLAQSRIIALEIGR